MLYRHRHLVAFLLAIVIHMILFAPIFLYKTPTEKFVKEDKKVLNLSQFEVPKRESQQQPPPKQKTKQHKKPEPKIQKPLKQLLPNPAKKELNTTIPTAQPVPTPTQKPEAQKQTQSLSALNDAFKSARPSEPKGPIKQLYGDEFERMSDAQKQFIKDNLGSIGRITEKHLRYPDAAGRLSMQGRSVVEFMLHPNGDISDLRLLDTSGYRALDKNSLETIEVAYKDYPRPSQKTKIRIYVHYQLY